jgi:uncharacterized protein (TIGR02147 family)
MLCRDFKPDIAHISRRLKQREEDMRPVLERMLRMGVLFVREDGSWENRAEKYITTRGYPRENNPARPLNHSLFEEGKRALETLPYEEREFLTLKFEADPAKLEIAREMFKKFRNELATAMAPEDREKAEVFCLAMGVFPLSKS